MKPLFNHFNFERERGVQKNAEYLSRLCFICHISFIFLLLLMLLEQSIHSQMPSLAFKKCDVHFSQLTIFKAPVRNFYFMLVLMPPCGQTGDILLFPAVVLCLGMLCF